MGHIPKSESTQIEILTFAEALKTRAESQEYDRDRWLYIPDFYSEYRYILGTVGKYPLITVGINPSTAAPDALDNTLESVQRIARGNGYDSFIMLNVYAQRATSPKDMDKIFNSRLHEENMNAFRWTLERCKVRPSIWAAWGTNVERSFYLRECMKEMVLIAGEFDARWYMAGTLSRKGHPHHPLYLESDSMLKEFNIDAYVESISFKSKR